MGQKAGRPPTFDHLRKKKPMERVVRVPLDGDAVDAFQEAQLALGRAEMVKTADPLQAAKLAADTAELRAALDAARGSLEATMVSMRFRSIGRKRYDKLVTEHPATDEQKAEQPDAAWNLDTFPPALLSASCIEPPMTVEEATELFETWNVAEFMEIWTAALAVNTQRRVVELGKGSSGMRG